MRTQGAILVANIIAGLALGYVVTNIGFGDYAELNRMFTFQDLRMFLAFAGAVVIIAVVFAIMRVRRTQTRIHAERLPGGSYSRPAHGPIDRAEPMLPYVITRIHNEHRSGLGKRPFVVPPAARGRAVDEASRSVRLTPTGAASPALPARPAAPPFPRPRPPARLPRAAIPLKPAHKLASR